MINFTNFDIGILFLQTFLQAILIIFTVYLTFNLNYYYKRKGVVNGLKLEIIRNLRRNDDFLNATDDFLINQNTDDFYHVYSNKFIDISRKECEVQGYFNKLNDDLVLDIDELYLIFENLDEMIHVLNTSIDYHDPIEDVATYQKQLILDLKEGMEGVKNLEKTKAIRKFLDSA